MSQLGILTLIAVLIPSIAIACHIAFGYSEWCIIARVVLSTVIAYICLQFWLVDWLERRWSQSGAEERSRIVNGDSAPRSFVVVLGWVPIVVYGMLFEGCFFGSWYVLRRMSSRPSATLDAVAHWQCNQQGLDSPVSSSAESVGDKPP